MWDCHDYINLIPGQDLTTFVMSSNTNTKDAEFNPSIFKRSIFFTIGSSFFAISFLFLAGLLFINKEFKLVLWDIKTKNLIRLSAEHSGLATILCYISGFLLLLESFLLVLIISKPQFTMRADYRRRIPVALAAFIVLLLALTAAYELLSIDPLMIKLESSTHSDQIHSAFETQIIGRTSGAIGSAVSGLIGTGFFFWVMMLPVNSRSCMARWLRPFHIRSESDMDQVADMQPAYQAAAAYPGVTASTGYYTLTRP